MLFTPLLVLIAAGFQCLAYGNILTDPNQSQVFLQAFMKNAIQTGYLPIQQANIADVINRMMTTMSAAQSSATSSTLASVIADLIIRGGNGDLIDNRKNAILTTLETTYAQMGEQVDQLLIQEINNQINVGLKHGEGVDAGFGLDDDTAVIIAKKFGCILKSSDEFDLAVLSGDRKAVIQAIIPAVRGSLGVKAAIALAHCALIDLGLG